MSLQRLITICMSHICSQMRSNYLGSCQSFLPKIYSRLMQIAPHLIFLDYAVAIENETDFIEGYIIVLEHHADALVHIQPNLAICERACCT